MSEKRDIDVFLFNDKKVCLDCLKQMVVHKQIYRIHGIDWHVLYEYNEFLERLFFRYKEQRDVVLKAVFLNGYHKGFSKYCVCALCSSDEKRYFRGFEPIIDILSSIDIEVYSPFYKRANVKQSSLSGKERKKIGDVLALKSHYPLVNKKILLVDDVCTTGSTLLAACDLLHPSKVFVIAAHPLWIEANKENVVVKKGVFW